ncbi:MAG TPA: MBL fold metallo-hydrolase [Methanomassiliicoccales archaeon]|nr:MBL fold metallo-hydrolase [Methanomassiliicoccales archaeon]
MRIVWHGHSCFEIGGRSTVVVDPHDGKSLGIKAPSAKADIVLITHEHFDHCCSRVIRGDFVTIREPGRRELKGVKVLGLPAFHDNAHGERRGAVTMFKFEMDGVTFCHCGDLGHELSEEQLRSIGHVDFLFVPVGGVFTLDGAEARCLVDRISPKVAVPMHFRYGGLSLSIQTVDGFLDGVPEGRVLRVGNEVEIEVEDLPSETEFWVFSP